jgi:hypothetical protein
MIFRKAVLFLAAAIATTTIAQAQLGVYGTISVNRLSGVQNSPFTPANAPLTAPSCPQPTPTTPLPTTCRVNDSVDPLGGTGGVYYDFKTLGPVRLGVDVRGSITDSKQGAYTFSRGGGTRIYSTLGGIRASFHTPIKVVKPYVQASVGLGRSDYGLYTAFVLQPPVTVTQPGGQPVVVLPAIIGNKVVRYNNLQYEGFAGVDLKLLPIMDFRVVELGYGALNSFGTNSHTYPIGTISTGVVFHLPF